MIILAAVYGFGDNPAHVMYNVSLIRNTSPERRSYANATFFMAIHLEIGTVSVLWDIFTDSLGYSKIFLIASIYSAVILIWSRLSKNK